MQQCAYVGPAPVPLEDYVEQVYRQAVTAIEVSPEALRAAFSHLVVSEELFSAVGPAIVSGKSVFIYGPPGNGKTAVARSIGDYMNNAGGEIYVPYAFLAEGSIITVYDQAVHQAGNRPVRREWGSATRIWFRRGTMVPARLRRVSATWATISAARSRNCAGSNSAVGSAAPPAGSLIQCSAPFS